MNQWLRWLGFIVLAAALQACASKGLSTASDRVSIPGGAYSWGVGQKAEDFVDVEVAQLKLIMYPTNRRYWERITPTSIAVPVYSGLQKYYPLQARWRLKDGREFILESVDTAALVRNYFETHALIKTEWERENRAFGVGDSLPMLAHYIKGETLRLKWVFDINRTPVRERLTPSGAATRWQFETEEYPVATVKGVPTSGIDFSITYDPKR